MLRVCMPGMHGGRLLHQDQLRAAPLLPQRLLFPHPACFQKCSVLSLTNACHRETSSADMHHKYGVSSQKYAIRWCGVTKGDKSLYFAPAHHWTIRLHASLSTSKHRRQVILVKKKKEEKRKENSVRLTADGNKQQVLVLALQFWISL